MLHIYAHKITQKYSDTCLLVARHIFNYETTVELDDDFVAHTITIAT